MRFISPFANYAVCVRQQAEELVAVGDGSFDRRVLQDQIVIRFRTGLATDEEVEKAMRVFQFRGLGEYEESGTVQDARRRLSVADTDIDADDQGWDAKTKREVEDRLRTLAERDPDFMYLEPVATPAPFPAYDRTRSVPKLMELIKATGASVQEALMYERENKNRDEVIAALEALGGEVEAEQADADAEAVAGGEKLVVKA